MIVKMTKIGAIVVASFAMFAAGGSVSAERERVDVTVDANSSTECVLVEDIADGLGGVEPVGKAVIVSNGEQESQVSMRSTPSNQKCRIVKRWRTRTCYRVIDQAGNYTKKCTPWVYHYKIRCN